MNFPYDTQELKITLKGLETASAPASSILAGKWSAPVAFLDGKVFMVVKIPSKPETRIAAIRAVFFNS